MRTPPPRREALDITKHDLDVRDGFLWSVVDGRLSFSELCTVTGFSQDEVRERLGRLHRIGAISWKDPERPPESLVPPPRITERLNRGNIERLSTDRITLAEAQDDEEFEARATDIQELGEDE